jgi:hypothetical protein
MRIALVNSFCFNGHMNLDKSDLQAIGNLIDEKMEAKLELKLSPINKRLDKIDKKIDRMDKQINNIKKDTTEIINFLDKDIMHLSKRTKRLESHLTTY